MGVLVDALALTETGGVADTQLQHTGFYTSERLQSARAVGLGGGIAVLLSPSYQVLETCTSPYHVAAAIMHSDTKAKHIVCCVYIPPASYVY